MQGVIIAPQPVRRLRIRLDAGDLRILGVLQSEGRLTNQELAEKVGMSTSPY
jgi:DNA-binding Lrp family transcriptional regulator